MPKTDLDPLGEGYTSRLRAELDRVRPRYSSPRYLGPNRHRVGAWRFTPVALAAAAIGMLGLTAYAATGSTNPVVWTQQIVTKIEPTAAPTSNPVTTPAPPQDRQEEAPQPPANSEPTERPEPRESPAPAEGEEAPSGRDSESSPSPGDR